MLDQAGKEFFHGALEENRSNFKQVYKICNNLLCHSKDLPLTPRRLDKELADDFYQFFIDKNSRIHTNLQANVSAYTPQPDRTDSTPLMFVQHALGSSEELRKMIMQSPGKSCDSDPIPISLIKETLSTYVDLITAIINKSMANRIFPQALKDALVKLSLKKVNLEPISKKYRPASNLAFLGKLIE